MAKFEVEVTFNYGDRHWQNRWDVEAADLATVVAIVPIFKDFHIAHLLTVFTLGRILARPAGERDAFQEIVYDLPGSRATGGAVVLPLFNTLFAALDTAFGGRPGKKFFRGFLVDGDLLEDGTIKGAIAAAFKTGLDALISDVGAGSVQIVLSNDKQVGTATVQNAVQMRQLHRKRKKPIL